MKKTYIIPTLEITELLSEELIAESMDKFENGGAEQLTKEERSDWSNIWE